MVYPKLSVIGGLVVAIPDQILGLLRLAGCCYRCSVPGAVCCCLLSPEGLLGAFGERHCNSKIKSLRATLLVRVIFSLWTPSLRPVGVPSTHSFSAYSSSIGEEAADGGKRVLAHICFFPQKGPPPSLKLPTSRVPDPHQRCWLQEGAAFILALLAVTLPSKKWIQILF